MGSYKKGAAISRWERFWNKGDYEKRRALKAGDAKSIEFYNQSKAADKFGKITQEDIDNYQAQIDTSPEALLKVEASIAQLREKERVKYQGLAESYLANQ